MTFEEAVRKAIRAYMEGDSHQEYSKTSNKGMKYNKSYFDEMDEELIGEKNESEEDETNGAD